ncbi:MAG: hypothetical protein KYX69_11815 [Sphingomonas sp.]|uniref:hypothetical protein n=1 Tax=Sphingomonas sp. TaxID=28214 RepID=UPI002607FF7C|nr:hypothetical protein [Sphingomonas sp.]MDK2768393.1 hypothetical protein [Sphingomonas sp.]
MPKATARTQLTAKDITGIVVAVTDLSHRVRPTWGHVQGAALSVAKRTFSRQALSAHPAIVEAYESKVQEYRSFRTTGSVPKLVEHDVSPERSRIERLEAEKADLAKKVAALDERLMLHIINAVRLGIPTRELERPSEKPYKGATDSTTGRRPLKSVR